MTNKERINRNIGLTFDIVKYLIDNPNKIKSLPDKSELKFIEKDFVISDSIQGRRKQLAKVKNNFELID